MIQRITFCTTFLQDNIDNIDGLIVNIDGPTACFAPEKNIFDAECLHNKVLLFSSVRFLFASWRYITLDIQLQPSAD